MTLPLSDEDRRKAPRIKIPFPEGSVEYNKEKRRRKLARIESNPQMFIQDLYSQSKSSAIKVRGIEFSLTLDELKEKFEECGWICSGTHRKMSQMTSDWHRASIDRIDSNRGYEIGNIQLVTIAYNIMKNAMPQDFFDGMAVDVVKVIKRKAKA